MIDYLGRLATLQRLVVVDSVQLSAAGTTGAGAGSPASTGSESTGPFSGASAADGGDLGPHVRVAGHDDRHAVTAAAAARRASTAGGCRDAGRADAAALADERAEQQLVQGADPLDG